MLLYTLFFAITCITSLLHANKPTVTIASLNEKSLSVSINVPVAEGDAWYQEYMSFSVDQPGITLSAWKPSIDPINEYDDTFKTNKKIFTRPFLITFTASSDQPITSESSAHIHMSYYQRSKKKIWRLTFPLTHDASPLQESNASEIVAESADQLETSATSSATAPTKSPASVSFAAKISGWLTATDSVATRLILAFLLGILLSLTPCIYPMIPITMGILQAQGSRSVGRSFCLASSYTMGIATTFALLGVSAAFTGKLFGSIMSNPVVIITIVGFMAYLALSMIGLYDMYIPSFLRPRSDTGAKGSLASAFLFGAISGTIASPCLSPGLLLLLTIVTATGSMLMGFLLLFSFGFGLGVPLLIIGTFSGSLSVLPRAGMWMVEVKQFFGFIMLGTCFYFLSMILPWHIVLWGLALFVFSISLFYNIASRKSGISKSSRFVKGLLGGGASALMPFIVFTAYKAQHPVEQNLWIHDYAQAIQIAQQENKKVLLDVSAPYCSICKAIDKKVFCCDQVKCELSNVIPVKIDNIEENDTTLALQKKFNIVGVPTVLLIDPSNEQIVQRWGSELYDANVDEFAATLKS